MPAFNRDSSTSSAVCTSAAGTSPAAADSWATLKGSVAVKSSASRRASKASSAMGSLHADRLKLSGLSDRGGAVANKLEHGQERYHDLQPVLAGLDGGMQVEAASELTAEALDN